MDIYMCEHYPSDAHKRHAIIGPVVTIHDVHAWQVKLAVTMHSVCTVNLSSSRPVLLTGSWKFIDHLNLNKKVYRDG